MIKLGVNIDHVATLRQARREFEPDPVWAARVCEAAGAHSIVCHLREDRRHINDNDVKRLRQSVKTRLNLEMSLNTKIVSIALKIKPDQATLVPERRQEITTEGGLDVVAHFSRVKAVTQKLQKRGIIVSLFVAADRRQIEASQQAGAAMIELHTGTYALAKSKQGQRQQWQRLNDMTQYARSLGITVNAGHGLNYHNTLAVAAIKGMEELNIGHAIVSQAIFTGLEKAVKDMLTIIKTAKGKS